MNHILKNIQSGIDLGLRRKVFSTLLKPNYSSILSFIFHKKLNTGLALFSESSFKSEDKLIVPSYHGIEIPDEQQRLRFMVKTPNPIPGMKIPKMPRRYDLIKGEEDVHTDFLHRQYGVVALQGGHLLYGHIEMIRSTIYKKLDTKRMFAVWRIEDPWKPHTKKGIGKRMGGGKGNISYYTTPVKAKRVIFEVGGRCTFDEVYRMLNIIAQKLPFPAQAMSQQMIEEERELELKKEKENLNYFTQKYIYQNNLLGSKIWARSVDLKYFGKYD